MKRTVFLLLVVLFLGTAFFSCKEQGTGGSATQPVTGATNELLVIMPKARWESPMGDTIRAFFGQSQMGLPQAEPMFDMINLPLSNFDRSVKAHRNVLMVSLSNEVDSATLVYSDSPWARTQKVFKITVPSVEAFNELFRENKDLMMNVYLKAERDRLISIYKKTPNEKVFRFFRDKYDILLYCPGGYNINKDTADFVWSSYETNVDSRGFIFFQKPYEHESQLNYQVILDQVNEEIGKYIPGPLDSTWMALDMRTPMSVANYQYDGGHYAMLIRGLWQVENDYMGGPFVLNVVLDEQHNRVLYLMAYVYAPDGKKRNMLRQVESIIFSMQMDLPEEKVKNDKK